LFQEKVMSLYLFFLKMCPVCTLYLLVPKSINNLCKFFLFVKSNLKYLVNVFLFVNWKYIKYCSGYLFERVLSYKSPEFLSGFCS
jgi:hypothetical protein